MLIYWQGIFIISFTKKNIFSSLESGTKVNCVCLFVYVNMANRLQWKEDLAAYILCLTKKCEVSQWNNTRRWILLTCIKNHSRTYLSWVTFSFTLLSVVLCLRLIISIYMICKNNENKFAESTWFADMFSKKFIGLVWKLLKRKYFRTFAWNPSVILCSKKVITTLKEMALDLQLVITTLIINSKIKVTV